MNTSELMHAPSAQATEYVSSTNTQRRRGNRFGATSHKLATDLLGLNVTRSIVSKCKAIENEQCHGVHPKTRLNLGRFLVDKGILNPGGLNERSENLCVWTMLEHIAATSDQQLSFSQLQSFASKPDQMNAAIDLIRKLRLSSDRFVA